MTRWTKSLPLYLTMILFAAAGSAAPAHPAPAAAHPAADQLWAKLPLRFETNQGQLPDGSVQFVSRANNSLLLLKRDSNVIELSNGRETSRVTTSFRGAKAVRPQGAEPLSAGVNYFRGDRASSWLTNVASYSKVRYPSLYPGIDLIFYGTGRTIEYDFNVAAGADPSQIEMEISPDAQVRLNGGDLLLKTAAGDMRWRRPELYQTIGGRRQAAAGRFVLRGKNRVGFEVARYDRALPLVIDPAMAPPVFAYSTFLGGSANDGVRGITMDASGNIYLAGFTESLNLPGTAGSFQPAYKGGSNIDFIMGDAFVAKLNPTGTQILYLTYIGGRADDIGTAIAVDSSGSAYVTGFTDSTDFPTKNPFQASLAGPLAGSLTVSQPDFSSPGGDVFIAKLNPAGNALVYSTFFGGTGTDRGTAIAVDTAGSAYVAGMTNSNNFPASAGAYQTVMKGGGGSPDLCDVCGPVFTAGDAFVAKLGADGSRVWATLLGGSLDDGALTMALAPDNSVWIGGATASNNFPISSGAYQATFGGSNSTQAELVLGDGFVSHVSADGKSLIYSTFLGGNEDDVVGAMALDGTGAIYVTGATSSPNFPHTAGTFVGPPTLSGWGTRLGDAFVAKLNFAASHPLVFSTIFGGNDDDGGLAIAVDPNGNSYVAGIAYSNDFPLKNAYQSSFGGPTGTTAHAFFSQFDPMGAMLYSTYLGGTQTDFAMGIALDGAGDAFVAGMTGSSDFPVHGSSLQKNFGGQDPNQVSPLGDAFVSEFTGLFTVFVNENGASFDPTGPIGQDSIATAKGTHLSNQAPVADYTGPTTLGGTTVKITDSNGAAHLCNLFYVSSSQVNYILPSGVAAGPATISITAGDGTVTSGPITIATVAPGVFTLNSSGLTAAVVLRVHNGAQSYESVYQVNSSSNVVANPINLAGDQLYLLVYGTGIRHAKNVTVTVNGVSMPVLFWGASTYDGEDQINVGPLPASLAGAGAVNVVLTADDIHANTSTLTFH